MSSNNYTSHSENRDTNRKNRCALSHESNFYTLINQHCLNSIVSKTQKRDYSNLTEIAKLASEANQLAKKAKNSSCENI